MHALQFIASILATTHTVLAHNSHDLRESIDSQLRGAIALEARDNKHPPDVTSVTGLGCATGTAAYDYLSCSSSVSVKFERCRHNDVGCACRVANQGLGCLTSHCQDHTAAVCAGSILLSRYCGAYKQPVPRLTNYDCPVAMTHAVDKIIVTDIISPSPATSIPPSLSISESTTPSASSAPPPPPAESDHPVREDAAEVDDATTTDEAEASETRTVSIPSQQTGAASVLGALKGLRVRKVEGRDPVTGFLGVGICVAIGVAGLAAFF